MSGVGIVVLYLESIQRPSEDLANRLKNIVLENDEFSFLQIDIIKTA